MSATPTTRHLVIVGRVQGVGFRYAMARKAAALEVTGWVRNRADGSVESVVQGSPERIGQILVWARHGPRAAAVDRVEVEPAEGAYADFTILPTA
jgi:acylphosphatase